MLRHITLLVCLFMFASHASAATIPPHDIVVSIKPIHSLVSSIMDGVGEPILLVNGKQSPHEFQLKPSQITALHHAKIIFYLGDSYEGFLVNALATLPNKNIAIALSKTPTLTLLPLRKGGAWEQDEHEAELNENNQDLHVWLNPENAILLAHAINAQLGAAYPEHKKKLDENTTSLILKIQALDEELKAELKGLENTPYIVFHDAYHYVEKHYNLRGVGSITFEPEESPTASRLREVHDKIVKTHAACVFKEPFVSDKLITTITNGLQVRIGELDPEGTNLEAGGALYFTLMRQIAANLSICLRG
jgi:zinc transport system substrate-binding protein